MFKICPTCKAQQPVAATTCTCGHQFRTNFVNPGQTQAFSGPLQPSGPQAQPMQPVQATIPKKGPRDKVEWAISVWGFWMLLLIVSIIVYYCLRWVSIDVGPLAITAGALGLLFFSVIKLRRLYVYDSFGQTAPIPIAIFLTVLIGLIGFWEYREFREVSKLTQGLREEPSRSHEIRKGMTARQVRARMGEPNSIEHVSPFVVVWHYSDFHIRFDGNEVGDWVSDVR